MTTVPDDERRPERMKPKSVNPKITIDGSGGVVRDETRSFLNFSRENLSMSHSELEQGFNKPGRCLRVDRQTMLSVVAIVVALVCAGIEIWKLHRVVTNAREIEVLKRDVETLNRMLGKDQQFMDALKAFEKQLYAEDDDDSGEADIEGTDYDNNYYDNDYYGGGWSDDEDSGESTAGTVGSPTQPSQNPTKGAEPKSTASSENRDRKFMEMLAVHSKAEAKHGQNFEKGSHEAHKSVARERLLDGSREHGTHKRRAESHHEKTRDDHPKQRREAPLKRIANEAPIDAATNSHDDANRTRRGIHEDSPVDVVEATERSANSTEATPWDRHPPKKYFATVRAENSRAFSPRHSARQRLNSLGQRKDLARLQQDFEVPRKSLQTRGITRRHLRAPRQVFAAHYGADSALFGIDDEHTGNGRAKHNEGVFKAWRPSDWVADLGMSRHFTLSRDGRLTVHEPGLYLVYGQIHYLDEHDENGFHVLVNNHPILQCMVYSPGVGHKSRSCFSAQITVLQAGDRLVLKDVGPARYTLFQHDKSFFGLVKLGDSRQQQQQQQQRQHSTQPPETLR